MELIKTWLTNLFSSRTRVVSGVLVMFSAVIISRLFVLQILNGDKYQNNYQLKLEKVSTIDATRGNIYDRNGNVLAYNELVYAVVIEDVGSYSSKKSRNEKLNAEIYDIIINLEERGDSIDNNFGIYINSSGRYDFTLSGSALTRFRADVFGRTSADELIYNEELAIDEANATPDQIMDYLMGPQRYNVSEDYSMKHRYEVTVVRYTMGQTSYQKYLATTIASDVSQESVAYIKENINELTGVDIEEKSLRRYVDSEYFAHIIGYTGQISSEEYNELSKEDETVATTDVVGKSGIEKYMNSYLSGEKGYEILYVDSVGNTLEQGKKVASVAGNDVYISLDKDLQEATYRLLEQEIAGIVYSKIENIKEYKSGANASASDVVIPIYDVYNSFFSNSIINVNEFDSVNASQTEQEVKKAYEIKKNEVLENLRVQLNPNNNVVYKDLPDEYQEYSTYIVTRLKALKIFDSSKIDSTDEMQNQWTSEELCVNKYLTYCIEQNWIEITKYENEIKYADTEELYMDLVDYVIDYLSTDSGFEKMVYKYLILSDGISGRQICLLLYDQGVLAMNEEYYNGLLEGKISAYSFLKERIKNLDITPAQLSLDPCSGSSVIIDTNTGELLACVTYPGYDNNKLANSVDASYYAYLSQSGSNPLYNYATQQRTAPGSTFKLCSSTAGLAEGAIDVSSTIQDLGAYEKVSNRPKCWAYPSNHGVINVSEAIRDSCNYFFYEVGYRLAGGENFYNDETGISKLTKYASLFGLDETTGIEIEENEPHIATEYPVMAAIGQSDHNFTTVSLARYVTAVANSGTVYKLTLLDRVLDVDGNVIEKYSPEVRNTVDVLDSYEWNAIHQGMRMVVESLSDFNDFSIEVAGKTGTAQQVKNRPNHALFVGYAPYDQPKVAIATRIAYGYTSHNAADVSKDILAYYFGVTTTEDLINGEATVVNDSGNTFTD